MTETAAWQSEEQLERTRTDLALVSEAMASANFSANEAAAMAITELVLARVALADSQETAASLAAEAERMVLAFAELDANIAMENHKAM